MIFKNLIGMPSEPTAFDFTERKASRTSSSETPWKEKSLTTLEGSGDDDTPRPGTTSDRPEGSKLVRGGMDVPVDLDLKWRLGCHIGIC